MPISLGIYDAKGILVKELIKEKSYAAGVYEIGWTLATCTYGVYYVQLRKTTEIQTRKIILLK
jgi:hypothetical protein